VSKRVGVDIGLDALQAAIGEWPGVGDAASRLGKTQQTIHNMLDDGRLKGIRTRVGWIIHPACVERVAREADRSRKEVVESPKEQVGS
jgi:DNA-binding MarR family transcriptional regulator